MSNHFKKKTLPLKGNDFRDIFFSTCYKFSPINQLKNPMIFVVYFAALVCFGYALLDPSFIHWQIFLLLFITVFFANFSEALAEKRAHAQTAALRLMRKETMARVLKNGKEVMTPAHKLSKGDLVVCRANDIIPSDGDVIEGIAAINEAAITGESAPVIRESGGDRCAVTGGTKVLSDHIVIRITSEPGTSFIDRMIQMVEGSKRKPTPNEVALKILLVSLTIVFIFSVLSLYVFARYFDHLSNVSGSSVTIPQMMALLVSLVPTTIGALLSAIGISGIDRLLRKNVLASSGHAVEAAGDIDVLLFDKTGTITFGNRFASEFIPVKGKTRDELARAAQWASLPDHTPEGRSIVVLAKKIFGMRAGHFPLRDVTFIPFSSASRISGVDIKKAGEKPRRIRKGSVEAIEHFIASYGGKISEEENRKMQDIARHGSTPLAVSDDAELLGVVVLKDTLKGGMKERFKKLHLMGIRTIMVTGDNPLTAAAIAQEAGVIDYIAQATPEMKLERIKREQSLGHIVGMIGDGTNDAPALAQADVGVAMNTGTQAAREAGNMVDLDSNPTKIIEIIETGRELLMTRGALTTFSVANDVAKYFTILPAILGTLYAPSAKTLGPLSKLNIMHLSSPNSAILSSLIFNALMILLLIPLAIRGVSCRPKEPSLILKHHLALYGIGGILAPFLGIKVIDILVSLTMLVTQ